MNSIFIELGGHALFYGSVNYERVLYHKNFFYLTGRSGVGYGNFLSLNIISVPILVDGVFQIYRAVAVEAGIGIVYMKIHRLEDDVPGGRWSGKDYATPIGLIGLRIQAKNGFLLRVDYTPFLTSPFAQQPDQSHSQSSIGISLGYSFGGRKN
jgi:hypothetical protein